jgi:hypothetical protein
MVARSALSNFHRRQKRKRDNEQVGLPGLGPDGTWATVDASSVARAPIGRGAFSDPSEDLQRYIEHGPRGEDPRAPLASRMVPYVGLGYTLKEIAATLSVPRGDVSLAYRLLRTCAHEWGRG